jgi:xanthine dehydrogenase small subunit
MIEFILNDQDISTSQPPGATVLDFVRYHKNLKGTKIGCREGDCGACAILVGELVGDRVSYRTMTSCLMPLANAAGKHIVTIEGINPSDGSLTPVQQAMVDESGTQCGFCTVGFVMSLTGFCIDSTAKTPEMAVSAVDGNICRCTGYKAIERAALSLSEPGAVATGFRGVVPGYFESIPKRLTTIVANGEPPKGGTHNAFVGGGTDVYVQRPDYMAESDSTPLFYDDALRGIRDAGEYIEIGASATVTDLLESPIMQSIFPDLYKHLKLVSSTPIRNMATLAGNFVNASPIGDMTVWFLALDAEIVLNSSSPYEGGVAAASADGVVLSREMKLRDLYLGYKQLAKQPDEIITTIRFRKPTGDFRFNFEKVSKRTYLDISTVNTAISLNVKAEVGKDWVPPALAQGVAQQASLVNYTVIDAHVATGGVAPIPLYLKETSAFLLGREVTEETITAANEIMQSEISPISDVRGAEAYKRLLLRQLFRAHFVEVFHQ